MAGFANNAPIQIDYAALAMAQMKDLSNETRDKIVTEIIPEKKGPPIPQSANHRPVPQLNNRHISTQNRVHQGQRPSHFTHYHSRPIPQVQRVPPPGLSQQQNPRRAFVPDNPGDREQVQSIIQPGQLRSGRIHKRSGQRSNFNPSSAPAQQLGRFKGSVNISLAPAAEARQTRRNEPPPRTALHEIPVTRSSVLADQTNFLESAGVNRTVRQATTPSVAISSPKSVSTISIKATTTISTAKKGKITPNKVGKIAHSANSTVKTAKSPSKQANLATKPGKQSNTVSATGYAQTVKNTSAPIPKKKMENGDLIALEPPTSPNSLSSSRCAQTIETKVHERPHILDKFEEFTSSLSSSDTFSTPHKLATQDVENKARFISAFVPNLPIASLGHQSASKLEMIPSISLDMSESSKSSHSDMMTAVNDLKPLYQSKHAPLNHGSNSGNFMLNHIRRIVASNVPAQVNLNSKQASSNLATEKPTEINIQLEAKQTVIPQKLQLIDYSDSSEDEDFNLLPAFSSPVAPASPEMPDHTHYTPAQLVCLGTNTGSLQHHATIARISNRLANLSLSPSYSNRRPSAWSKHSRPSSYQSSKGGASHSVSSQSIESDDNFDFYGAETITPSRKSPARLEQPICQVEDTSTQSTPKASQHGSHGPSW